MECLDKKLDLEVFVITKYMYIKRGVSVWMIPIKCTINPYSGEVIAQ